MILDIKVGEPIRQRELSVFPLFTESESEVEYLLSAEAFLAGTLAVEEISEGGSVPTVLVENKGQTRVLFLAGEEIVGAKQNRVLNTSILIAANSTTRIPVSCVEAGRWRYKCRRFKPGGSSPSSGLRRILTGSVHRSLKRGRGHTSDQRGLWEEVARQQRSLGVVSITGSFSDTVDSCRAEIDGLLEGFEYVEGASGLIVAFGNTIVALDLLDKPATCKKVWNRLLIGPTIDVLELRVKDECADVTDAENFVGILKSASWEKVESVGEGQEHRTETATGECGFRLSFHGSTVHASAIA
jgi:hypothetical protein